MTGTIESVLRLAHGHLKAGRYDDAIPALLQAARLLPDNPVVFDDLGRAYLLTRRLPEAVTALRRAIALRPTFARTHCSLGLALAQAGDYEAALAAHRRAIELEPRLSEAHGRAADILLRKGRRDEAVTEYERACAVAPDSTFGRLCGAKAMVAQDRPSEAEERLGQLLERDPSSSEAHLVLAHILNEAGRFDEAAASFERSIALAPWQATAYSGLVSSRRLTEADRPLVARIVSRLEAADVAERQRMTLHFAAGKALDDLRDYAGAIQHFDAANAIRRKLSPPFDRKYLEQRVDRIIARYSRDFFAEHATMGQGDETPVLVLGMPRSGTTLIERIVSSHPRVGGGGELAFWNERGSAWADAETGKLAEAAGGLRADYLRLLRSIGPDALRVTDKMPFNFLWIGLVHLLFPNARVIHCRRNPIDTCLSIYSTQFTQSWGYASERGDLAFYYRQYLRLMEHWRAVLPPDRFLDVDYEDATAAPEGAARRLVAFAGLEWDAACLQPERNPDAVKTASTWQARQPIYRSSVERWRNYEPWIGELRSLLDPAPPASSVQAPRRES
jgi:tetratricopeptide (TPR) repeat protein